MGRTRNLPVVTIDHNRLRLLVERCIATYGLPAPASAPALWPETGGRGVLLAAADGEPVSNAETVRLMAPQRTTDPPDWSWPADMVREPQVGEAREHFLGKCVRWLFTDHLGWRPRPLKVMRACVLIAVAAVLMTSAMTAPAGATTAATIEGYLVRATTAWEAYTTPNGEIVDPLVPGVSQDNYGSIMLADTMLQLSARDHDPRLAATGAAIINRSLQLPETNGPFNLEAVAEFIRDGEAGLFPSGYWSEVAGLARAFAAHIVAAAKTGHCLPLPGCYNNWRLVWAAGVLSLLQSRVPLTDPATLEAEALEYVHQAVRAISKPARPTLIPGAAELSDPGAEPLAYAVFSAAQLEEIADAAPGSWGRQDQQLRKRADAWLLQLMAPDGQLVYAGRSLDQSWAQTAGVYVGARESTLDPVRAAAWAEFSSRAFSYLEDDYAPGPNGAIPVVPGLTASPEPGIMDPYASDSCYAGMTLWWLMGALDHWPSVQPPAPLPADSTHFVIGDLSSSGLVWGRSGPVWWSVQGRRVCGADPRCEQGLAAVKLWTGQRWQDLLALRPIQRGQTSQWELEFAHRYKVAPQFTSVDVAAGAAVLHGFYFGPRGRRHRLRWRVRATTTGVVVTMTTTPTATVSAKLWLAPGAQARADAVVTREAEVVTASGAATPVSLRWAAGITPRVELRGE